LDTKLYQGQVCDNDHSSATGFGIEDALNRELNRLLANDDSGSCLGKFNREITMLVLSRKLGEKIVIGDNIIVTVVKIDRNQIRIGIEAPSDVPVYREEIAPQRLPGATRVDAVLASR
jgi:carbon storage regulator